jgi:hypothetical protein
MPEDNLQTRLRRFLAGIILDQRTFSDEQPDILVRKTSLTKNFAAMLAETRRVLPD